MKEDLLQNVLDVLNTNIENAELTLQQAQEDLSTLGMDSITFIRVIVALEETFDIEIPDEKLLITEMNTVSKIADVISTILNEEYEYNTIDE